MKPQRKAEIIQREKRYDLKRAVKARLYLAPLGANLTVRIVNISKSGVSVRSRDAIPENVDIYLLLNNTHVRLLPTWELPAPEGCLAYGFKCARRNIDLVNIFVSAGVPISNAKEKIQSDEERFVEEFSTIEFEAFPAA